MRSGWFIGLASAFYLFVVALFWPIEQRVLPQTPRTSIDGYAQATVVFSDTRVQARIPTTLARQEQGLAGVTALRDDEGMLWEYASPQRVAFWMKGMLIPLDFVWIADGTIVDLTSDVQPPASASSTNLPIFEPGIPVDHVLEVPSGFIQRHGLQVGEGVRVDS